MRILTTAALVFIVNTLLAQGKLDFEVKDHDFGKISEADGPAEFTFDFVNNSETEIRITNVKASCGCTTPGWTKESVPPGGTGFIKAKYNPRNRPGKFRKSLRISTSDPGSNQTLYISGFVNPKPKTPEQEYPIVMGDLRMKYRTLNLGKITTEKIVEKTFDVYNGTDSVVTLSSTSWEVPEFIQLSLVEEAVAAGETGQLKVSYDPVKKNDYGFVSDNIRSGDNQNLSVMAVIEEYFPEMTAKELDKAPKLELSSRSFDFGKVNAGTSIEKEFMLTNLGKEKLLFRSIKSNCGCLTYEIKDGAIKKGKSQRLKVLLDTSDMRGNQYKTITIYSNDPVAPTQIITIKGNILK